VDSEHFGCLNVRLGRYASPLRLVKRPGRGDYIRLRVQPASSQGLGTPRPRQRKLRLWSNSFHCRTDTKLTPIRLRRPPSLPCDHTVLLRAPLWLSCQRIIAASAFTLCITRASPFHPQPFCLAPRARSRFTPRDHERPQASEVRENQATHAMPLAVFCCVFQRRLTCF